MTFVKCTVNNYMFGALDTSPRVLNVRVYYSTKAGLYYSWNTGDTTATIQVAPNQSGLYSVIVYDTSGCKNRDSVQIDVKPSPLVDAGADTTLCSGETHQLNGSTNENNFVCNPITGLSDGAVLNPVFNAG